MIYMVRGLSPVITTVLLLLISIAAVGGAWLWYQKMSNTMTSGGAEQTEKIKQGTALNYLYLQGVENSTDGYLLLKVGNTGANPISLDNITIEIDGRTYGCGSDANVAVRLEKSTLATIKCDWIKYDDVVGKKITITFISGGLTKEEVTTPE